MYFIPKGAKPAPVPPQAPPPEPVAPTNPPPKEEPERPPVEPANDDVVTDPPADGPPAPIQDAPPPSVGPVPDKPVDPGEEPPPEPVVDAPASQCTVRALALSNKSNKRTVLAKTPGKVAWYSVSPKATDTFSLSFDSNTWGGFKKTVESFEEVSQKFSDYTKDKEGAKAKWEKEAAKTGKNMLSLKVSIQDTLNTDFAEVHFKADHQCKADIQHHKLSSTSSGQSPDQGLAPLAEAGKWALKAKPPTSRGRDANPRVYTVQLPECAPGKDAMIAKVCVFPARREAFEFTFHPKRLNEISKKLSSTLKIFGQRLKFEVTLGKLFAAGVQGWFEEPDGTMVHVRELSGGAKPLAKAEITVQISALEACTGVPAECWDYIADIGAKFTLGGSLDAKITYQNRYLYSSKKTENKTTGEFTGKLYAGIGLYAKAGPKDIAQVSVEAGGQFGLIATGKPAVTGDAVTMPVVLSTDAVKLTVTLRTKYLWVFGSEHPSEWVLSEPSQLWSDNWTIMKFDSTSQS